MYQNYHNKLSWICIAYKIYFVQFDRKIRNLFQKKVYYCNVLIKVEEDLDL